MLKPETTQDLIVKALREDIANGLIAPGAALRQEDLAERFRVSRIPVREALRRLESDGVVTVIPNRGAFVIELSADEIQEIVDLRLMIEGDLIERAVPHMDDAAIDRIVEAARLAEHAAATANWIAGDRSFHMSLYLPAGRLRHLAMAMNLRTAIERYESLYRQLPQRRTNWLSDHRSIVEACTRHDAVAARACLSDHIAQAGAFLIAKMHAKSET